MAALEAARREFNDPNIVVAGEENQIIIGVPFPSLVLEYLLQSTVIPLSRVIQVVGTEGTCKSALGFEIARWFKQHYGQAVLFENETKYAEDFAGSILSPGQPKEKVMLHLPCYSIEDWQRKVLFMVEYYKDLWLKKTADRPKPTGRVIPVVMILDSIMGKASVETQDKIIKTGFADRSFPLEALKITSFMRTFPQLIEKLPITFIAVNHLKPQKSESGPHMERHKAGGRGISFQETIELEMSRDKSAKISLAAEDSFEISGLNLKITCRKNGVGETGRTIPARILWKHVYNEELDKMMQITRWDWDTPTITLLTSFDGSRKTKIDDIVDLHKSTKNTYWSRTLGIPSSDPLPAAQVGQMINSNMEVRQALRRLFGIKSRKEFQTGVDYVKQLEEMKEEIERKLSEEK